MSTTYPHRFPRPRPSIYELELTIDEALDDPDPLSSDEFPRTASSAWVVLTTVYDDYERDTAIERAYFDTADQAHRFADHDRVDPGRDCWFGLIDIETL